MLHLVLGQKDTMPEQMTELARSLGELVFEFPNESQNRHPAALVDEGDKWIEVSRVGNLAVATHNEGAIYRVLRRVEEGTISAKDVCIYVPTAEGTVTIPVNSDGELTKSFPGGFFDHRCPEIFGDV